MKLKVETLTNLSQDQRQSLQRLGCDAIPFISWPYAFIFAATCEQEQEQELRRLAFVTNVELMPTYHCE